MIIVTTCFFPGVFFGKYSHSGWRSEGSISGAEHSKGRSRNSAEVVLCFAESLVSFSTFFLQQERHLWPLLQILGVLVTDLSPESFFCLKMKTRQTYRMGRGEPLRENLPGWQRAVEILEEGFDRKRCLCFNYSAH